MYIIHDKFSSVNIIYHIIRGYNKIKKEIKNPENDVE